MKGFRVAAVFAALLALCLFAGTAGAATILFVDSDSGLDSSWQTLIESGGHTFTRYSGDYNPNTQAEKDAINNNYDVVVMSGSNPNFNSVRTHGANWNTLATPMILMGNYLASGQFSAGSWQWTTPSTSNAPSASGDVDVLDESDLIWTGVTFDTAGPPPTIDLFSSSAGHLDLGSNSLLPNIALTAAQSSNNNRVAVAHAAPDALRAGSQEQYFIASFTGGAGQSSPFSSAGEQVFLNAVDVLSGEVIPEPSTVVLLAMALLGMIGLRRRK